MAQFTITITLGNDAMLTPTDVAETLNRVADTLWPQDKFGYGASGGLYDVNGNRIGDWQVTDN